MSVVTAESSEKPHFSTAVVKVASRCNLDCTYCYVYRAGDTSFRERPAVMTPAVARATIERVRAHCARHGVREFTFCFHGGEPLLAPRARLRDFVAHARAALAPSVNVRFVLQTNGVLLDRPTCRALRELDVHVGVSIDGPPAVHDRHRVDHRGIGSYAAVRRGWDEAAAAGLDLGVLMVVDPTSDPVAAHDHLADLAPRRVDLLLPAATHDRPPARPHRTATPHGDWLLAFFRRWESRRDPAFRVRLFDNIAAAVFGIGAGTDAMGSGDSGVVVIETDGAIEPVDVLRASRPGLTRTPLSVLDHDLDDAFAHPLVRQYVFSHRLVAARCQRCAVLGVCGGGYLPHRYGGERGFDNPSVYCFDLLRVIAGVQSWVVASLSDEVLAATGLAPLDYELERQRLDDEPQPVARPGARGRGRHASLPLVP